MRCRYVAALLLVTLTASCGNEPPREPLVARLAPPSAAVPASTTPPASPAPPTVEPAIEAPAPSPPPPFRSDEIFSILIQGGEVIDGSGTKRRRADVLVRGDRVAFVGAVDPSVKALRILDASGAVVTPGFIDAHAHGDTNGDVEYALAQGVTTLVVGQDGQSAKNIGAWLAKRDAEKPRVNVAALVGHATMRAAAGISGAKEPSAKALESLKKLVGAALDEGAFGASTGLEYDPGRSATVAELVALGEPVGARGGVVMSHLRSEDDDKIGAALAELVESCRKSGARAHVAHLKIVLGRGEERAKALLSQIEEARASGVAVTADLYPYTASYTGLSILFPDFARPPASYSDALQNRRADLLAALRARVEKRNGPGAMLFGTGELAGKTLLEAARDRKMPFEEVLLQLGPNGGEAAYFVMDDAVVTRLFMDPFVMIGTDGSSGVRHPRGYGAFAKVIEDLVQKRHLVPLEEAVRKMAGLPAETLGLTGERGCVKEGCAADLLIFVPEEVHARSDFQSPHRLASGMGFVLVNGLVEREAGHATPARGGRALHSKWRHAPKPP